MAQNCWFSDPRRSSPGEPAGWVAQRIDVWRPEPESNRRARICSPLRNHSAIGPEELGGALVASFALGSSPCLALLATSTVPLRFSGQAPRPLVFLSTAVGARGRCRYERPSTGHTDTPRQALISR